MMEAVMAGSIGIWMFACDVPDWQDNYISIMNRTRKARLSQKLRDTFEVLEIWDFG